MKFIIDAQLPRRLAKWLVEAGHDALHTLDLPVGNRTSDAMICEIASREMRVVITKDSDFVDSFYLRGTPPKILLVSTGNIPNPQLEALFAANLGPIIQSLDANDFVEIDHTRLSIHS